ncbi:MAG: hypothetical protein AAFY28_06125 [Actinomycetota bacterium]
MRSVVLALALVAVLAACSSSETTEEIETRVRAEVWVDDRGGDVDDLIQLCMVDSTDAVQFEELVSSITPDALAAMQFTCPVLGDQVAAELE